MGIGLPGVTVILPRFVMLPARPMLVELENVCPARTWAVSAVPVLAAGQVGQVGQVGQQLSQAGGVGQQESQGSQTGQSGQELSGQVGHSEHFPVPL